MKAFAYEVTLDLSGIAGCHFNTETVYLFADDLMDCTLQLEEVVTAFRKELAVKIGPEAAEFLFVQNIRNCGAILEGRAEAASLRTWAQRTAKMIKKDMEA